jgi:hypothetical protein
MDVTLCAFQPDMSELKFLALKNVPSMDVTLSVEKDTAELKVVAPLRKKSSERTLSVFQLKA